MNVFEVLPHNHHSAPYIQEVMAKSGDLLWGAPGWYSTGVPDEEGPYIIHYSWGDDGSEFVGIDYFIDGRWGRRWTEYPRFEWCVL